MPDEMKENPQVPPKLLWGIIAAGTIVTVIFTVLMIREETLPQPDLPSPSEELKISVINDITISTNLPENTVEPALSFVQKTVRPDLVPQQLIVQSFQKGTATQGDTFLGTWNRNGIFLSLLVGLTTGNSNIQYLRVWATPQGTFTTKTQAQKLLAEHFSESFLRQLPSWDCEASASAQRSECGTLFETDQGDRKGFYLLAPFLLETPPDGATSAADLILVSACAVPADTKNSYAADRCL